MNKTLHLKSLLLLGLLLMGASSVWADSKTSTLTFTEACKGSGTADDGVKWTVTSDAAESTFEEARGIHYGTGSVAVSYVQLETTGFTTGTITKVVVNASGNNSPSLSVTVGGNAFGTTATGITTSDAAYTFNGNAVAGKIVIRLAKSSSAKKALYIKSVAVTYDEGASKEANEVAWSASEKDVTYSETPYDLPTLTNPHSLDIEYASSNPTVASIDEETGEVTINNATGSTTISATTLGDDTYAAGTVSYTLNVTKKVILEDGVFNFSFGEDYGSGVSNDGQMVQGSSCTWTSGNIEMTAANRYAWYDDGTFRIYKSTSSYKAGTVTFTCPDGYVITQIDFTSVTGTGALTNMDSNIGTFTVDGASATWTGAAPSVVFTASGSTYMKTIAVTYTNKFTKEVGTAGYATWVAPYNVEVPSGVSAFIVTSTSETSVDMEELLAIPAGVPVVLKGFASTYTFDVCDDETLDLNEADVTANLLQVSDGATAVGDDIFVLANKNSKPGFYRWSSASSLSAGKVYLQISGAGAREFIGFGDEATGIGATLTNSEKLNSEVFDLQGRRVAQPVKGLYIVNGKKIIIK